MRIGSLNLQSKLFLSPLAGYTNLPFRLTVREIGGLDLATTDLVNARSLLERNPKALKLIETVPIDGALIDVNLSGEIARPVSQALADKHIPLILVTGYTSPPLSGFPVIHKPFEASELRDAIIQHLQPNGGGDGRDNQGH